MRLDVRLLGGFEVRSSLGAPMTLHTKKAQALLAYCVTHPDQPQSREKLATLLWGDRKADHARNSLRQALFILRAGLPSGVLHVDGDTISINRRMVRVDVADFERWAVAGKASRLEQAARLYKGDFLDGFVVAAETFEDWLFSERERLRDIAMNVWAELFQHQRQAGLIDAAIQTGRRLLACDPGLESAHRALISLLMEQGRRGEALRQYEACTRVLRNDLSLEPEPKTQELYRQIVSGRPVAGARPATSRRDRSGGSPSAQQAARRIRALAAQEQYVWLLRALRAQEQARRLKEQSRETRAKLRGALSSNAEDLAASRRLVPHEGRAAVAAVSNRADRSLSA
jgi:DNA-binding SARP family transcriptional activator